MCERAQRDVFDASSIKKKLKMQKFPRYNPHLSNLKEVVKDAVCIKGEAIEKSIL